MKNYQELIDECDLAIRSGRPHDAGRKIAKLNSAQVPREWRLPLAKICRRTGAYSFGLKLLTDLVNGRVADAATPEEITEYAGLLIRVGAIPEGMEWLNRVDTSVVPLALLYRTYGHFLRWEYKESMQDLQQYLRAPLAPYAALVGRTNLALAYVETRQHALAVQLLDENIKQMNREEHGQLLSSCYALRAQSYIQEKAFSRARQDLDAAKSLLPSTHSYDQRSVTKWVHILDGLEQKSVLPFLALEKMASENNDWESLRECEFYRLKVDYKRVRFVHLYFGTPYAGFRDLIFSEFGDRPTQAFYVFGSKEAPRMDLRTGDIDGRLALKPGNHCHRLIEVLLRDFYQPLRVAGLFLEMFPGEHFDISSSPNRVRQLVRRTRQWFKAKNIPVQILESDGFYSLRIDGNFSFRVPLQRLQLEPYSGHFDHVKKLFSHGQEFLAKDLEEKLQFSNWEARQFLKWGIEKGLIQRIGDTKRSTKYKVI